MAHYNQVAEELSCGFTPDANFPCIHGEKGQLGMMAYSKNTRILSMNGGFVSNAMCDTCTTVIPAEDDLKMVSLPSTPKVFRLMPAPRTWESMLQV